MFHWSLVAHMFVFFAFFGFADDARQYYHLVYMPLACRLSYPMSTICGSSHAATMLAQQRAKLKASNAAHRISAPAFASSTSEHGPWAGASPLGQVAERDSSPMQEITIEPSRHALKALIFPVLPPAPPSALLTIHYIYIPKLIECSFFWKHSTVSTCPVCSQNNYEK